jgi:phage gpG-like protein
MESLFHDLGSIVADTDYTETLADFQQVIAGVEMAAFGGSHEPGGAPWAELAPSTVKRKGHGKILYESGDLMASLIEVGGPGNISEVSDHGSIYGTSVLYAIFHDQGTSRMPARPPVGINQEAVDKLADMVAERTIQAIGSL